MILINNGFIENVEESPYNVVKLSQTGAKKKTWMIEK